MLLTSWPKPSASWKSAPGLTFCSGRPPNEGVVTGASRASRSCPLQVSRKQRRALGRLRHVRRLAQPDVLGRRHDGCQVLLKGLGGGMLPLEAAHVRVRRRDGVVILAGEELGPGDLGKQPPGGHCGGLGALQPGGLSLLAVQEVEQLGAQLLDYRDGAAGEKSPGASDPELSLQPAGAGSFPISVTTSLTRASNFR